MATTNATLPWSITSFSRRKIKLIIVVIALYGLSLASLFTDLSPSYINSKKPVVAVEEQQPSYNPKQQDHGSESDANDDDGGGGDDPSFSACLLIMDDNHLLIEWLAYHYTTLPLRRLIVAVDPRSKTSPLPVLERWKGRINYTIWNDDDFIDDFTLQMRGCERARYKAKEDNRTTMSEAHHWTGVHRMQQRAFLNACTKALYEENRTWTMYVDTDEYIGLNIPPLLSKSRVQNFLDRMPPPRQQHQQGVGNGSSAPPLARNDTARYYRPTTIIRMLQDIQQHNVTRDLPRHYHEMYQSGCLLLPRHPVSPEPSTLEEMHQNVPSGFNASQFATLKFRHGKNERQHHPKPVIDISRFDPKRLHGLRMRDFSVHGGIDKCISRGGGKKNPIKDPEMEHSYFVVNHYPLTFEQFAFRDDARHDRKDRKEYNKYMERYNIRSKNESVLTDGMGFRGWLDRFQNALGGGSGHQAIKKDNGASASAIIARSLLKGAGELVGDHQSVPINYTTSVSYENCQHYNRSAKQFVSEGQFVGLPDNHFNATKRDFKNKIHDYYDYDFD